MSQSNRGLTSSMSGLAVSKKSEPAESWEDDAEDEQTEAPGTVTPTRPDSSYQPRAPPPTPASPSLARDAEFSSPFASPGSQNAPYDTGPSYGGGVGQASDRRPDKSTSVASRLIAAGIGQKLPRRTQEQREYDQAMRLQEKKRRDQAREAEERQKMETQKAKQAMWDD